jgi:hypothetical protein
VSQQAARTLPLLLALAGCRGQPAQRMDAGDTVPPAAPAASPASRPADAMHPPEALVLPCRAIALDGRVEAEPLVDGSAGLAPLALALQGDVPAGWLALADGSRLVAKDPRTARETTFHGPARVRDCLGGAEEAWLARGSFESTPGAGEAPGSEEWVVTPHAVVRYAAAKVRVDVRPTGTTATIGAGVAFLWPPQDKGHLAEGWQRLNGGEQARVAAPLPASARPRQAVERCAVLATRSKELAAGLFAAVAGTSDAGSVAEQVTTRRLARAACSVARVDLEVLGEGADAGGGSAADASGGGAGGAGAAWAARLAEAEAAWRALPLAPVSH